MAKRNKIKIFKKSNIQQKIFVSENRVCGVNSILPLYSPKILAVILIVSVI